MRAPGEAFVGRADELALLAAVVADRGPTAVVVSGPSGIGKTGLVEEAGRRLRADGSVVAVGRTWPDGDGPSLWPWFEVLDALGIGRDVLAGPVATRADRFARTIHALAVLDPAPVVVLEDLHAADVDTLLLTRLVVRAAGGWRGTVVGTRQPGPTGSGEVDALLVAIEREARSVPLGGLAHDEVAEVLRREEPRLADDVVGLVHDLTRGHPFHVRALAGSVAGSEPLATRLEDEVTTLLGGLPGPARTVVEAAAVIGGVAGTAELAAATGMPGPIVTSSTGLAMTAGLLQTQGDGLAAAHDAVRDLVLAVMAPSARGEVHARLAHHLAGGAADDRGRGAQHALAAADLGTIDVDDAVGIARRVAAVLRRGTSLVVAAGLLDRAVATARSRGRRPDAELLVERAETTLSCGRLQDARLQFEEAAAEAEGVDDRVSRARAALGLGGVWLGEHREVATAERVRHLQRTALADLPSDATALRARLELRIAAEDAYRQGSTTDLAARLAVVRATGDDRALVEGLSLVHHATLHPGQEDARLGLADEQLVVATALGDELLVLVALVWRVVDLFLLGDPRAERAHGELARRADAVQCQAVIYVARVMEVMLLLRAGRVDEAEAAAATCLSLGTSVGDADAVGYYGVHLFAIRLWQAREVEVLEVFETIARSPEHPHGDRSVLAACALLAARSGDHDRAAAIIRECTADGLSAIKVNTTWLACISALSEAACIIGDTEVAAATHGLLLPHADLPVLPSFAVAPFGSVHRFLGLVDLVVGRVDDAVAHLRAAVVACERWDDQPSRLLSQNDLARALLAGGDGAGARHQLRAAVAGARRLGLDALADRWAADAPSALWTGLAVTRTEDGGWVVGVGDERVALPDLVGCRYLALLVASPGREVAVLRLAMDVDAAGPLGRQDVLDGRAMADLRRRVDDLRAGIDAAESAGNAAAAAARREELDAIAQHLATSLGLGGRVRSFDDLPERARTSVQKAIRRVIDRVATADPLLGDHLRRSTRTGLTCCYAPQG